MMGLIKCIGLIEGKMENKYGNFNHFSDQNLNSFSAEKVC